MKNPSFFLLLFFVVNSLSAGGFLLPESYRLPALPRPGTHGCASCGSGASEGNEIPSVNHNAIAVMNINLLEEIDSFSFIKNLLSVRPGTNAVFSPESRFLLLPPETEKKRGRDYLRVVLGTTPIRFRAKINEVGHSEFYSYTLPGYSLKRENDKLAITDFNSHVKYRFASFDGGQSWKLDSVLPIYNPAQEVKCKYNADGLVTELILPGNRKYQIHYKYGQPVKVMSPAGAVTEIEWSESGTIRHLVTRLTSQHPLFADNAPKKKNSLCIVRDLYFTCSPLGVLQDVVNTSGERYSLKTLVKRKTNGWNEKTTIITYPDGYRKFRTDTILPGRRKILKDGVVVDHDGVDKYIVKKTEEFVHKNGTYIAKGAAGVTNEYRGGTLAITAEVDAYGNRTSYAYNACGQRILTLYPDHAEKIAEYDKNGSRTKEVDECGRIKTWRYNADGLPVRYQYGDMAATYSYDEQKRLNKVVAPGNLSHYYTWDSLSRLVSYTRPDGVSTVYEYFGDLDKIKTLSLISSDKKQKYARNYVYDANGRLTRIKYPDRTWEGFAYDCCNMIAQKDRAGNIRRHLFNQLKQKIADISDNGAKTSYEYDIVGNLLRIAYPDQTYIAYAYTENGDLYGITESNKLPETYENDKLERRSVTKRADGVQSKHSYNNRGRLAQVTGELERNISYNYDSSGNIIKSVDWGLPKQAKARTSQYAYDNSNRRIYSIFNGEKETTAYIPGTSMLDHSVRNGIYRFLQYDKAGRQISSAQITQKELDTTANAEARKRLILTKRNEFKRYDAYGNLSEIVDGHNNLLARYTFLPDGQIQTVLRPTSDSQANLQTYRHHYNQDGEQIFEIYQKTIPLEEKP